MTEWLNSLRHRLRALLRRRQLEQDLQDEVSFHLAMREEELRGTTNASDARAGARRQFGNVTRIREDLRDTWAFAPALNGALTDLRYAARTLRGSLGFATVVVLTLGLGIGANTAFFSVVNAVLIRPLGYVEPNRLVSLHESFPQAHVDRLPFSAHDFEDLLNDQQSFTAVAAYRNVPFELSGSATPERITGAKVSAELFGTLGVSPLTGRTFSAADDHPGANVAVLSWGLWQRRFGGTAMLGQRILLDRQPYTVVGIMPAGFVFPRRGPQFNGEPADIWVPIALTERKQFERGTMHDNSVIARLKNDVTFAAAQAEMGVLGPRIAEKYPPIVRNSGFSVRLVAQPLREEISGRFAAPLLMLLAAVGLVLLVACANVANLILSRMTARTRELAVRTALGARRTQLVRLLLCEALLLAAAGGAVGIALAYLTVKAAPAVLVRTIPGLHDLTIDFRVLAFTAIACLATAVICTLVPLPTLGRTNPVDALRDDASRATAGVSKLRIQRGFVVLTVCLACLLLAGAGLLIRSFAALVSAEIGFQPAQVLTASMALPRTSYPTNAGIRTFHESLLTSLSALPGVRTVALATDLPLKTYDLRAVTPEGAAQSDGMPPTTNLTQVHGPFFETLGIALKQGRFFAADEYAQTRAVVIVNEKLAERFWPGQHPIGKRLKWGVPASRSPWLTVVGVVGNVADSSVGAEPELHAYEPFRQLPDFFVIGNVKVAMLAEGDPLALASLVRHEIARLDPALAVEDLQTMDEQIREAVAPQRFSMLLVGAFATIALLLASVGLYGLLAFTTGQRRKEIALRLALGAERRAVIGMVIGQGARLVAVGLTVGLICSIALARVVASLLHQTSPYDLVAFAIIPAALVPAAFLACALPAWHAARVEPTAALRAE